MTPSLPRRARGVSLAGKAEHGDLPPASWPGRGWRLFPGRLIRPRWVAASRVPACGSEWHLEVRLRLHISRFRRRGGEARSGKPGRDGGWVVPGREGRNPDLVFRRARETCPWHGRAEDCWYQRGRGAGSSDDMVLSPVPDSVPILRSSMTYLVPACCLPRRGRLEATPAQTYRRVPRSRSPRA